MYGLSVWFEHVWFEHATYNQGLIL